MAATEARAAWQRGANRFCAQEDNWIAPKFSSTPSSSSSKSLNDATPAGNDCGPDTNNPAYIPTPRPLSNMKWWLNTQPITGQQIKFTHEWLHAFEAELDALGAGFGGKTAMFSADYQNREQLGPRTPKEIDVNPYDENQSWKSYSSYMKNNKDSSMSELKALGFNNPESIAKKKDIEGELWCLNGHLMDRLISEQRDKLYSDMKFHWMEAEKTEPWWCSASKNELAMFVAKKSLENIENCDLPQPQIKNHRKTPSTCLECFDQDEILASSLDQIAESRPSSLDVCKWGSPVSVRMDEKQSNQSFSYTRTNKEADIQSLSDDGPSKAELLEALCHSQTRAREAEKAAKRAYTEKEHIVTLFFRQASQLFAYKQWFQLLQLQNICLQLRKKDQPITHLLPSLLPWVPSKGKQFNRKRKHGRREIRKCAVAFAVGLGLAAAGVLLGWTMGWLFPTF